MCVSTGYIPGWRFLTVDKILHSVELTLAPWCQVLLPTHCVLGEIPRLSHIWVVSKKWFFLGVFLAWIDGIVSFLFCCFNANEYWPPFLSSFYWFPVKLQDIMLNKCHKGHWVIIERVVSTVPLGVQGLCPTPISAVFKWPKGPLLADSTIISFYYFRPRTISSFGSGVILLWRWRIPFAFLRLSELSTSAYHEPSAGI